MRSKKAEHCIFCDVLLEARSKALPSSSTKEHLFPRWFRDSTQHKTMSMYTARVGESPVLERRPTLEKLVNTNVCRTCNNGWMSQLEVVAEPIIKKLQEAAEIESLLPDEIEILARWTGKTAAVLSHITPQLARVPQSASETLHPNSTLAPRMRFFYSKITSHRVLENGYLQISYGEETPLIGVDEVVGTRFILCVDNHCLIVDFPPIPTGISYDLKDSCCAMLWPHRMQAGKTELHIKGTATLPEVMSQICRSIHPSIEL